MDDRIFYYMAIVPFLGMVAQWLAWLIRVPSILLLLGFGVLLGFWMNPDQILMEASGDEALGAKVVFPFVSLSVAVILFEGGLSLRFGELKNTVGAAILRLCTIGALVSWILTSLLAWWVLEIHIKLAVLLGAVLVVTGPTVVVPLLRHIRPNRKIGSIVKWEGIIIDPIGAILAVLVFEQLFHVGHHGEYASWWGPIVGILKTSVIGVGLGCVTSWLLVQLVRNYWIPDYLHGVTFLACALAAFALSNWMMHESGLVTVTVMGIYLANQKKISIEHVVEFKENLGVFLISCLFIVLGSRLDLQIMGQVGWQGVLFVVLMILIVRPASVFAAMIGSGMPRKEVVFLSGLAPRGIVAAAVVSVFSLRLLATVEPGDPMAADAQILVPATFMLIVGTVLIYGLGAAPLARRLGLADNNPQGILFAGADPWICDIAGTLNEAGYAVVLVDTNFRNISDAKMRGLPAYCKSILSEYIREEANLAGIGKMFALTKNDAINAIAAQEYSHLFGSQNVYRLKPRDADKGERAKVGHAAHGRELFSDEWSENRLRQAWRNGFRAKLTKITDEFTFEDFRKQHGEDVIVLLVIDSKGVITVNTTDHDLEPTNDKSVLALVKTETSEAIQKR